MTILFYKSIDPYGYMNNFCRADMFIYGRWWKNVEAAYQAQKTNVASEYDAIWLAKTPRIARNLGQVVTMRPDWEDAKIDVMYDCVLAKFTQNADLRAKLLSTGDEEIVEDSPIDSFWGCGVSGNGKNHLGKILMQVREDLRKYPINDSEK